MSYGTNSPQGLQPIGTVSGAPWTASIRTFTIASADPNSYYNGTLISPGADGNITIGAASTAALGVFQGCYYVDATNVIQKRMYWPGNTVTATNTLATADIITDPNTIYDIQVNNGALTTATATNNFNTFNCIGFANGSTITGYSSMALNVVTPITNDVAFNAKIIGLTPAEGNAWGLAYNNVSVIINNHFFRPGVAGV